jgi:5-methylcytosine-specific restriction endonuclease McrA
MKLSKSELKILRSNFRNGCLKRDNYQCVVCKLKGRDRNISGDLPPLDVHHIKNRKTMPCDGYALKNGISLCDDCHIKAENYFVNKTPNFQPEYLYSLINSSEEEAYRDCLKLNNFK